MKKMLFSDDKQKILDGLRGLRQPMLQEQEMLFHASPLPGIGKIGILDGILCTRVN